MHVCEPRYRAKGLEEALESLPEGLQRVEAWTSVGRNLPAQVTASQGDGLSVAAWRLAGAKENAAVKDPSNVAPLK